MNLKSNTDYLLAKQSLTAELNKKSKIIDNLQQALLEEKKHRSKAFGKVERYKMEFSSLRTKLKSRDELIEGLRDRLKRLEDTRKIPVRFVTEHDIRLK